MAQLHNAGPNSLDAAVEVLDAGPQDLLMWLRGRPDAGNQSICQTPPKTETRSFTDAFLTACRLPKC